LSERVWTYYEPTELNHLLQQVMNVKATHKHEQLTYSEMAQLLGNLSPKFQVEL